MEHRGPVLFILFTPLIHSSTPTLFSTRTRMQVWNLIAYFALLLDAIHGLPRSSSTSSSLVNWGPTRIGTSSTTGRKHLFSSLCATYIISHFISLTSSRLDVRGMKVTLSRPGRWPKRLHATLKRIPSVGLGSECWDVTAPIPRGLKPSSEYRLKLRRPWILW